jgi:putative transcriptional regulator
MIDTQGKLLVAPPKLPDWRFQKSVVYMWKHDVSGACGIIVNKKCNHPDFKHVCKEGGIQVSNNADVPVYYGGPVLTNIVGVLHTKDVLLASSNHNNNLDIAFTLDRQMLLNIAAGKSPKKKIITLGMAQWSSGQLEAEFEALPPRPASSSWLVLDYDPEIIFGPQPKDLWEMCVSRAVENKTKEILSHNFKD